MDASKLVRKIATGALMLLSLWSVAQAETLKVGVIAPLTGPGAQWGLAAKWAAELLATEVNAAGGLTVGAQKYPVQIVAYDDQYKASEAVAAYNRLVNQDGVRYVVIATSAATMALKQNVETDKVVAMTSAYSPQAIDANSKYMFRQYSIAADFLPAYADWMVKNLKERQMATLNPNDETGWTHSKVTGQAYKEKGFNLVGAELYERSTKDFQSMLTKVLAWVPNVIDLGGSAPASAGLIVRQARELGYRGRFVQTGGPGWAAVVASAGKEAAEGMVNMLYADPSNKGYQRLAADYKKAVGQVPNEMIVCYYDATNVLLHAIQRAGTVSDTSKVVEAIPATLPMKSLQGDDMVYSRQQIRTYDYIGVMRNGEPVVTGKIR